MAEEKKKDKDLLKILKPFFLAPFRPPITVPGTINESRRALAILRNAEQGRFIFRGSQSGVNVTNISQPSIGRSIRMATLPPELNFSSKKPTKTPITYLDFFRQGSLEDAPFGVSTDPVTGEIRRTAAPSLSQNARYQGMKFNLGQAIAEAPTGQFKGQGTTGSRRALYTRGTGGAIGPTGMAQVRPDGTWQPRDTRGRLGTARPNPSAQLQQGLRNLASGSVTRAALPVVKRMLNVHPAVQAYINIDDMIRQMSGSGITERTRDQIKESIKKDNTYNIGPLLPF